MSFRRDPAPAGDPPSPGVAPLVASPAPAASPPPCAPEAPHVAVLVGEVAARLAAAVLEVGEAAAVEQGGPLAAPGALEGLHEAVVEAVVARAHAARLAHRGRLRTGAREPPDLPSDRPRPRTARALLAPEPRGPQPASRMHKSCPLRRDPSGCLRFISLNHISETVACGTPPRAALRASHSGPPTQAAPSCTPLM